MHVDLYSYYGANRHWLTFSLLSYIHGKGCNVLFFDAHASWKELEEFPVDSGSVFWEGQ
jgi:prepilin-type processing-associated H-X9-DG protein